ncbi:MAG: hypothetical protein JNN20_08190 [Betaproteobacteria bacterium]|nr:hypothetical protein [Betaproteobacteria bacterium]
MQRKPNYYLEEDVGATKKEDESSYTPGWKWLVSVIVLVIFVVIIWSFLRLYLFPNSDEAGKFGDYFGGVNALFSGLAFAGLIYTVLLQKTELALQRQELKETRAEIKKQAEALAASVKPRIEVGIKVDMGARYLIVQNNGQMAANNIAIRCTPDLSLPCRIDNAPGERKFSDLPIARNFSPEFANTNDQSFTLDPGEKLAWLVSENLRKISVTVEISYESPIEGQSRITRIIGGPMYELVGTPLEPESGHQRELLRRLDAIASALRGGRDR